MPRGRKPKPMVSEDITCPWCEKKSHITVKKEIVEPSVPAQTRLDITLDKSEQATLDKKGKK